MWPVFVSVVDEVSSFLVRHTDPMQQTVMLQCPSNIPVAALAARTNSSRICVLRLHVAAHVLFLSLCCTPLYMLR